jgi:hypothetical protein
VIAYKFLKTGAVGLVSGFQWPMPRGDTPGQWVEAQGPVRECESGIHVCRPGDLPYWMFDELWAIEVEGNLVRGLDMLIALRGRLLGMLSGWSAPGRVRLIEACRDRMAEHIARLPAARRVHADAFMPHMDVYLTHGWAQLAALCSAMAIASTVDAPPGSAEEKAATRDVYRRERTWQAEWMVRELALALPVTA